MLSIISHSVQFSSVQSLSRVRLFVTPWIAARQVSLSITNSQNLLKLMSIESVMPSIHLILCHLLLLPPSINLSQQQGLFQWINSLHEVAKVLEFHFSKLKNPNIWKYVLGELRSFKIKCELETYIPLYCYFLVVLWM